MLVLFELLEDGDARLGEVGVGGFGGGWLLFSRDEVRFGESYEERRLFFLFLLGFDLQSSVLESLDFVSGLFFLVSLLFVEAAFSLKSIPNRDLRMCKNVKV